MTTMNNNAPRFLNDSGICRLADIYLSFLDIPTNAQNYRFIKNAVILCAFAYDDMQPVYAELEKVELCSAAEIKNGIVSTIDGLPQPIEDMFNNAYCPDAEIGFMPHHKTADDIVAFLGKTFLYLMETNYKH